MTAPQIVAAALCQFKERGFTLEQCSAPAEVICRSILAMPTDSHERLISLSVQLFAERMA